MAYKDDNNFSFEQRKFKICVNQIFSSGNVIFIIIKARNVVFISALVISNEFISKFQCFLFFVYYFIF